MPAPEPSPTMGPTPNPPRVPAGCFGGSDGRGPPGGCVGQDGRTPIVEICWRGCGQDGRTPTVEYRRCGTMDRKLPVEIRGFVPSTDGRRAFAENRCADASSLPQTDAITTTAIAGAAHPALLHTRAHLQSDN